MGHSWSIPAPKMSSSPVVISASGKHECSLIFLHGLGDTGHGWATTLAEERPNNMKIICPTANTQPVTLNSGFKMPAWFDLMSLDPDGSEDETGIKKAAQVVENIIQKEIQNGVKPENIILGGFSQGGALALYTGLTSKHSLGGVLALSCWLPLRKEFPGGATRPDDLRVLQLHGDCDPVVPYRWGQMSSTLLKGFMKKHEFKSYKGLGHSSNAEELNDVKKFVAEVGK